MTKNKLFDVIAKTLKYLRLQGPGINARKLKMTYLFFFEWNKYSFEKLQTDKPSDDHKKGRTLEQHIQSLFWILLEEE